MIIMGSSLGTRVGTMKDWDSTWYKNLFISNDLVYYSICNRHILLKKLLGEKNYENIVNKIK